MTRSWFTAKAIDTVGEISIYDEIGAWGITAKDFQRELKALGPVSQINLSINSPGGEVFDGLAIHNMLKRHKAHVTVSIDGIAASIASVIACAGDTVNCPANAMWMIHNPSGVIVGTSKEMRDLADALDKIRNSFVSVYADKTGMEPDAITKLMDAETWLSAEEAVAMGFADTIEEPVKMAASFDLSKFRNAPAQAEVSPRAPVALHPAQEVTLTDESTILPEGETATDIETPVVIEPAVDAAPAVEAAADDAAAITARAVTDERTRTADILAACALVGKSDKALAFITAGKSLRDVVAALQTERTTAAPEVSARHSVTSAGDVSASWDKTVARTNARFAAK